MEPPTVPAQYSAEPRLEQLAKPTAYVINTARGGLIDHDALYETLKCLAQLLASPPVLQLRVSAAGPKSSWGFECHGLPLQHIVAV